MSWGFHSGEVSVIYSDQTAVVPNQLKEEVNSKITLLCALMKAVEIKNNAPVSPLRYPGAKRWMSGYISRSIAHNDFYPELFVEPFAGGASVSLALLHCNLVERIALVDRDPLVSSFWHTAFFDTEWLLDQIWKTEITVEKWERLRRQTPTSVRQRAFKCLYLNRTSFSGVLAPSAVPYRRQNSGIEVYNQLPVYQGNCDQPNTTGLGIS